MKVAVGQVKERGGMSGQRTDHFEKIPPGLNEIKPKMNHLCDLFRAIKKDTMCSINTGIESGLWRRGGDGLTVLIWEGS